MKPISEFAVEVQGLYDLATALRTSAWGLVTETGTTQTPKEMAFVRLLEFRKLLREVNTKEAELRRKMEDDQ